MVESACDILQDISLTGRLLNSFQHVRWTTDDKHCYCTCVHGSTDAGQCLHKHVSRALRQARGITPLCSGEWPVVPVCSRTAAWRILSVRNKDDAIRTCVVRDRAGQLRCQYHSSTDCYHTRKAGSWLKQNGERETGKDEGSQAAFVAPRVNDVWLPLATRAYGGDTITGTSSEQIAKTGNSSLKHGLGLDTQDNLPARSDADNVELWIHPPDPMEGNTIRGDDSDHPGTMTSAIDQPGTTTAPLEIGIMETPVRDVASGGDDACMGADVTDVEHAPPSPDQIEVLALPQHDMASQDFWPRWVFPDLPYAYAAAFRGCYPRPAYSKCFICDGQLTVYQGRKVVFGRQSAAETDVVETFCDACKCGFFHIGSLDDHTIRTDGVAMDRFLIQADVLWDFSMLLVNAGMTFGGYHSFLKQLHFTSVYNIMPEKILRNAFFFLIATECDLPVPACILCGTQPRVIVTDGVCINMSTDQTLSGGHEVDFLRSFCIHAPVRDIPSLTPEELHKIDTGKSEGFDSDCRKAWAENQRRTYGLFQCTCVHKCIQAYHFVYKSEGLRDLFYTVERYFETPPSAIIFDFACAARKYFKRRSDRYDKTVFAIDSFHARNHRYDPENHLKSLRQSIPELSTVRSSGAESLNKSLRSIEHTLSGMSEIRAYQTLRHWTLHKNSQRCMSISRHVT